MILGFVDTETTGVKVKKGDRIVEIALVKYRYDEGEVTRVGDFVRRINPLRDIAPEAQAVHGISLADLANEPTWEVIAPDLVGQLTGVDMLIAHNLEFDLNFMVTELTRVGLEFPDIDDAFCTMDNGRWATPNGKLPRLAELAYSLDLVYDTEQAHGALYDIELTAACYFKAVKLGFFEAPMPVLA